MTNDGFIILSNSIALAATICFFSFIAFTIGFNKGVASVVTEEEEEEENVKYVYVKPEKKLDENEITDRDDEETKIQKLRNKIEQEKTNKFFD